MLTSLSALLLLLSDALRAVTAYYNTLALRLYWSSAKNLNRINEEIIRLESAGDPRHRDRLGLLRLQRKIDTEHSFLEQKRDLFASISEIAS